MVTTPVHGAYRHFVYEASTKTIWYMDEKPESQESWEYLGSSNNPIPASAATALTQTKDHIKGSRVKRFPG